MEIKSEIDLIPSILVIAINIIGLVTPIKAPILIKIKLKKSTNIVRLIKQTNKQTKKTQLCAV